MAMLPTDMNGVSGGAQCFNLASIVNYLVHMLLHLLVQAEYENVDEWVMKSQNIRFILKYFVRK